MFVATPINVFTRRYGELLYLFNRSNWTSALLNISPSFDRLFSRHPVGVDCVAQEISNATGVDKACVECDIMEVITPLISDDFLVCGNQVVLGSTEGKANTKKEKVSTALGAPGKNTKKSTLERDNAESGTNVLMEYFKLHPTPFELCIDLTQACTARCVHCYVPGFDRIFLPKEFAIKAMREFKNMGGLKVKFTGGECMLHPDFIELLNEAAANDLVISVLSNLSVCGNEEIMAMLQCNVAVVQCSLYGADAKTHEAVTRRPTFSATINAIKELRKKDIPVRIHCPVMKQNIEGIDEVLELGRRMGIRVSLDASIMSRADHVNTNRICELTDGQLYEYLKKYEDIVSVDDKCGFYLDSEGSVCEIGTSKICLAATGVYYPCNGCYDYVLGDCHSTLAVVWNGEPIRRIRTIKWNDMKNCLQCVNLPYCSVCPSRNFNATKNFAKPDPTVCRMANFRRLITKED